MSGIGTSRVDPTTNVSNDPFAGLDADEPGFTTGLEWGQSNLVGARDNKFKLSGLYQVPIVGDQLTGQIYSGLSMKLPAKEETGKLAGNTDVVLGTRLGWDKIGDEKMQVFLEMEGSMSLFPFEDPNPAPGSPTVKERREFGFEGNIGGIMRTDDDWAFLAAYEARLGASGTMDQDRSNSHVMKVYRDEIDDNFTFDRTNAILVGVHKNFMDGLFNVGINYRIDPGKTIVPGEFMVLDPLDPTLPPMLTTHKPDDESLIVDVIEPQREGRSMMFQINAASKISDTDQVSLNINMNDPFGPDNTKTTMAIKYTHSF